MSSSEDEQFNEASEASESESETDSQNNDTEQNRVRRWLYKSNDDQYYKLWIFIPGIDSFWAQINDIRGTDKTKRGARFENL